ncbi:mandelate racemase/muconate lactonizing enzyme family protein [Arsenicitalea aurantiaca]|uniref:Mandelate racemase/muconate lactonizing enzyme family protein n=1 Tax=Arsenicitalea aurantiaca TaxID=1783274 RepID=A0A433X2Q1_9HYPH|nr:mandelate racemase/muconate lactonizing enzyme family protein [Arsenicitalea aurantiaca]RUT28262.1 mandelate racemase/muconate lactonizing enzyme family protein [Arsenicitalea aurantiaca]
MSPATIAAINCHLLTQDTSRSAIGWAGGQISHWNTALVEVRTREGVSGWGEAYYPGLSAPLATRAIVENYAPLLLGEDATDAARLFHKMRSKSLAWGKAGLPLMVAGSIEVALWDIKAQMLGVPLHHLFGGTAQDAITVYASGGNDAPRAQLIAEMEAYREQGFRAVKIRIGRSRSEDVAKVRLCREVLGPDIQLMVDAVMGHNPRPWSAREALDRANAIAEFDITWLEDPVGNRDYEGCAFVRAHSPIPIAAGETAVGLHEFLPYFEKQALDWVQPDPTHSGGIGECRDIAALARAHGVRVVYHSWGMAPCLAANYALAFADPDVRYLEYPTHGLPLVRELAADPHELVNGQFLAPTTPGLGVRLTPEILAAHGFVEGNVFWP